jgi:hypothetical protein
MASLQNEVFVRVHKVLFELTIPSRVGVCYEEKLTEVLSQDQACLEILKPLKAVSYHELFHQGFFFKLILVDCLVKSLFHNFLIKKRKHHFVFKSKDLQESEKIFIVFGHHHISSHLEALEKGLVDLRITVEVIVNCCRKLVITRVKQVINNCFYHLFYLNLALSKE